MDSQSRPHATAVDEIVALLHVSHAQVTLVHHPAGSHAIRIEVTPTPDESWLLEPDPTAPGGNRWLLLGECHGCGAINVPVARITTRADLDAYNPNDADQAAEFWSQRDNDGFCDCTFDWEADKPAEDR